MGLFDFLKKPTVKNLSKKEGFEKGILVFSNTTEVIQAEKFLKADGWEIKVKGPPPEVRTGCDLVIEFPLIEELKILNVLREKKISPIDVLPVISPLLKPVDLFQKKMIGKYLMVRAANMKITIDTESHVIVNISGGGCPDVPYLAREMIGKKFEEAPKPRDIGHTLCGYALHLAYEELFKK
jgi:hypothetical protein